MLPKKRKIKKRQEKEDVFSPILIAFFLIAITIFLVFSNIKINQTRREMAEKVDRLKEKVELMEERNRQLKEGIFETGSDVYWEAKLYEQGYKKPGEEAIVIIPPLEEEELIAPEEKDFFQSLIDWVLMRD